MLDIHEAYTSRTVSWAGERLPQFGSKKVVTSKIGRRYMPCDLNGAREIFLRTVVDTPSLRQCIY